MTVAVSHSDGERTFLTQLGHLATLEWAQLRLHVPPSRRVLLAGAFLTPALRREYPEMLTHFEQTGTQVALDMGWPDGGYTPELRREVLGWLPQAHHLLINDLEAQALTGESDLQRAAGCLTAHLHPEGTLVIKCGAEGPCCTTVGRSAPTRPRRFGSATPSEPVTSGTLHTCTPSAEAVTLRLRRGSPYRSLPWPCPRIRGATSHRAGEVHVCRQRRRL